MSKIKKAAIFSLCLMVAVAFIGCGSHSSSSGSTGTTKKVEQKDKNTKKTDETAEKTKDTKTADNKDSKSSDTSDKKTDETKSTSDKDTNKSKKPSGHVLTVKCGSKVKYYTESDLKKIGIVSYRYSYRNKKSEYRQFGTFSGVKFSTLISRTGFSGTEIRVVATDGYTKEYSISDLKTSKWAFKKTTGTAGSSVPAIITVGEEGSFRLCFGQAQDDSDDNGCYNMQDWAKWIDTITVM